MRCVPVRLSLCCVPVRLSLCCIAVLLLAALPLRAQQAPDTFRWVDFHSQKDQSIVIWVTRSLTVQKWTSIREIGVLYDAALVVTADRPTPQSSPATDTFTVWTASLTSHSYTRLLSGVNLRWFDPMHFADIGPEDIPVLYDNCRECAAVSYFTTFHYDVRTHTWEARWMRGGQGVPVLNAHPPDGVAWTQIFAVMADPNGHGLLATWNHFDFGKQKPPEDFVYQYDVDPFSELDRNLTLSGAQADAMKLRLCNGQDTVPGIARGQDSEVCRQLLGKRPERRPVTTPPANNHGRSGVSSKPH